MTEQELKFHRTFLSLEMCKTIYNEDERYQNYPGGPPNRQGKIESNPAFKYHVHSCPRYPQRAPGTPADRQYNALLSRGDGNLEPLVIIPKRDQRFANAATPWEFVNSVLCSTGALNPIVNASMEVTGHTADVSQEFLIHPKGIYFKEISDYIKNGVELYFWNYGVRVFNASSSEFSTSSVNPPPPGWEQFKGTSYNRVTVAVDPDGKVEYAQGHLFSRNNGVAISTWSPLDFWTPGTRLAAGAIRVFTSRAGRVVKAGVHFFTGPTKEMAEWAAARFTGRATARMALSPVHVQHLGRRTIIAGEDMASSRVAMAKSHAETGFYDIGIHGNNTSFGIYVKVNGKNVWHEVSVREVADAIRPHLAPGDKIRLLSCKVGVTGGPAQELANELNRTVWAATTNVPKVPSKFATSGPDGIREVFIPKGGGTFSEFVPHRGAANFKGGKSTGNELQGQIRTK